MNVDSIIKFDKAARTQDEKETIKSPHVDNATETFKAASTEKRKIPSNPFKLAIPLRLTT